LISAPRRQLALTLAAMTLLGVPGAAGDTPPVQAAGAPAAGKTDYVIGPGDVLQIVVWKEPELTRDVTVRVDGKITVPLLGEVEAAGQTPAQLGADLQKALVRFFAAPQVTVGVAQATSRHFFVIGQVTRPGNYPLGARMTVLQGLALAGGLREFAKADSIVIVRPGQAPPAQTVIPVNYKKIEEGKDVSQNILLKPGDTIVVP
jgi:polysaccharide export outer membrane protein